MPRPGALAPLLVALVFGLTARAAAAEGAPVEVRWLGVAGFSIASGDAVLLHDPFLSRPGLWRALTSLYRPDRALLERLTAADGPLPEASRARLVLVGHSHYDHLGDAPWFALARGAAVAGSATTAAIARAYGVPSKRVRRVDPGAVFDEGPFRVRVVESRHARIFGAQGVPRGELSEPPEAPIHALSFVLGDARGYLVTHRPSGVSIYALSSAAVYPPALAALREEGVEVDVVLAATQGRSEDYASQLVESLRPRLVVPHHFDDFFRSIDHPEAGAPTDPDDVEAFESELREAARRAGLEVAVRRLALFETLALAPAAATP